MKIYCCECKSEVEARLTNGKEIYPHRDDLYSLPFWKCDCCGNFVGCHYKTNNPTRPLGVIPNQLIKNKRRMIHELMDPLWQTGKMKRGAIYSYLSKVLGCKYHTASLSSIEDCEKVMVNIIRLRAKHGLLK